MAAYKIRIEFNDGTAEVVDYAEQVKVVDGVLRAEIIRRYGGPNEHVGSWPLANVRKWKVEDR